MTETAISAGAVRELEAMRAKGFEVFGPGPMTPGETTPTPDAANPMPGMHVQVKAGHRLIEGFGGTADEAVFDAAGKLAGYDPTASVRAPAEGGPRS